MESPHRGPRGGAGVEYSVVQEHKRESALVSMMHVGCRLVDKVLGGLKKVGEFELEMGETLVGVEQGDIGERGSLDGDVKVDTTGEFVVGELGEVELVFKLTNAILGESEFSAQRREGTGRFLDKAVGRGGFRSEGRDFRAEGRNLLGNLRGKQRQISACRLYFIGTGWMHLFSRARIFNLEFQTQDTFTLILSSCLTFFSSLSTALYSAGCKLPYISGMLVETSSLILNKL